MTNEDRITSARTAISGYEQEIAVHRANILSRPNLKKYTAIAGNRAKSLKIVNQLLQGNVDRDTREHLQSELNKLGDYVAAERKVTAHHQAVLDLARAQERVRELRSKMRELQP